MNWSAGVASMRASPRRRTSTVRRPARPETRELKAFFRSAAVQGFLAAIFAGWLRLCYATLRWEREGQEKAQGVWAAGGGVILCFWHARIPLAPQTWPQGPDKQDM